MKKAEFKVYGHENILATHYNTIEFTKEPDLSKKGDCIVGVKADYDLEELKGIVEEYSKIKIVFSVGNLSQEIFATTNKGYDDEHELVIRKSEFISPRTFAVKADKAAVDLDRKLVEKLKDPSKKGIVEIIGLK